MKPRKFLTQNKIDKLRALIDDNNGVIDESDLIPLLKDYKKQLDINKISQQREMLKAFADVWNRNGYNLISDTHINQFLDNKQ